MAIFGRFFKKKGEQEEQFSKINEALKGSFTNVKKDVLHLHTSLSDHKDITQNKLQDMEERIKRLELVLMYNNPKKEAQIIVNSSKEEEIEQLEEQADSEIILNVLKGLPRAEIKLFKTLYDLQTSLNAKHISYKSLASYLYPGKDYNSIRSTITQFVLRLYTEGLIDKQRIGKETYIKITPNGYKLLKNAKIKKMIKEAEIITN